MEEVKTVLDVPTFTALCEQELADEEWQAWYGRSISNDDCDTIGFNTSGDGKDEDTRTFV